MMTEENILCKQSKNEPVIIPHLTEAIEKLIPESVSDKITISCEDDICVCVSLEALVEFIRALIRETISEKTESVSITSDNGFFYVTVKSNNAFYKADNLIKYARSVGFLVDFSETETIFTLTTSPTAWMNLYAENRNKLLALLKVDTF